MLIHASSLQQATASFFHAGYMSTPFGPGPMGPFPTQTPPADAAPAFLTAICFLALVGLACFVFEKTEYKLVAIALIIVGLRVFIGGG